MLNCFKNGIKYLHFISFLLTERHRLLRFILKAGLIPGLHQANETRCYKVTLSLIGWAQAYNKPSEGRQEHTHFLYAKWGILMTWWYQEQEQQQAWYWISLWRISHCLHMNGYQLTHEAETKWPPFSRWHWWHFEMDFLELKCMNFD